jgi:peptide/nickel transport system substrate-binding protein
VAIDTYKMDPAAGVQKAGALLDQVGWKLGSDGTRAAQGVAGVANGTKFTVTVPYENNWPAAECNTLLLQSTMKKVGVNIVPDKHDAAAFWGQVAKDQFTMYHGGARSTNADDLYLNWFHTGGAFTPYTTHLSDPSLDKQIDNAVAGDASTAKSIYGQLEAWQADYLPMLVTGHQFQQVAMSPKLKGWYSRPDSFDKWLVVATIS